MGYCTAANVQRGWTKYKNNPIVQNVEGLFGTGHHSFFTDKEGRMRIVFHAHHGSSTIHPRMMYIGTMAFEDNVLTMTNDPIIRPKLTDDTAIEAVTLPAANGDVTTYDLTGRKISAASSKARKGHVRILRQSDGKVTKKLF